MINLDSFLKKAEKNSLPTAPGEASLDGEKIDQEIDSPSPPTLTSKARPPATKPRGSKNDENALRVAILQLLPSFERRLTADIYPGLTDITEIGHLSHKIGNILKKMAKENLIEFDPERFGQYEYCVGPKGVGRWQRPIWYRIKEVAIVEEKEIEEIDVEFSYNNVATSKTLEPIDGTDDKDEHYDVDF